MNLSHKLSDGYSIRLADPLEVYDIVRAFIDESPYKDIRLEDNHLDSVFSLFTPENIKTHMAVVLVKDEKIVGILAAVATEGNHHFITDKIATELMWYVYPDHRGTGHALKLVEAYEEWCRQFGVKYAAMTSLVDNDLQKLYKKLGYKACEIAYMKEIS